MSSLLFSTLDENESNTNSLNESFLLSPGEVFDERLNVDKVAFQKLFPESSYDSLLYLGQSGGYKTESLNLYKDNCTNDYYSCTKNSCHWMKLSDIEAAQIMYSSDMHKAYNLGGFTVDGLDFLSKYKYCLQTKIATKFDETTDTKEKFYATNRYAKFWSFLDRNLCWVIVNEPETISEKVEIKKEYKEIKT